MNIQVKWKLRSTPKSRTMISSSKYQQPATNLLYYHWLTQHPTRTVCSFLPVTKYSKPQHIEFEDTTSKKNKHPHSPADRSWGGLLQVGRLKDQTHLSAHLDDLTTHQTQLQRTKYKTYLSVWHQTNRALVI